MVASSSPVHFATNSISSAEGIFFALNASKTRTKAIFAIAQTDLILTVPRRLAKITAVMAGIRVVEAHGEIQSLPHFMYWDPRATHEPSLKLCPEQLRPALWD